MSKKDRNPTVVSIQGVKASGRHGANPGEQLERQDFVIDIDVWTQPGADDLEDTTDYRDIADTARAVVEEESFVLLETLAEAVADAVFALGGLTRVTATVHKPGAAVSLGVAEVMAEATVEE